MKEQASLRWASTLSLPIIRQAEHAECGLACLAMVAGYFGQHADLADLRRRFGSASHGLTLKQIAQFAADMGLQARPLRADINAVRQLKCPCILHWDMNHFVVMRYAGRRRVCVHDPAQGVVRLRYHELADHFTGVALELSPATEFKATHRRQRLHLSDLWTRIVGLKRSLVVVLVLSLLLQLFALVSPFYLQTVIDDVALRGDRELLTVLALSFALLLLLEVGTQALRGSVLLFLSTHLHLQLAANMMSQLLHLPARWFQHRHLGDVLSRFSSIDAVREILSNGLIAALVDGVMAIIMLLVMLVYDARLTAIVLLALLLYVALRVLLFRPLRQLSQDSIAKHALCDSSLMESARAMTTVKLLQGESERHAHWHNRLTTALNCDIRIGRLNIGFGAANTLLFGLENITVVYLAADAVIANQLTIGMLVAFISYKQRFTTAIHGLLEQCLELMMLGLHLERLSDIALSPREPSAGSSASSASSEKPVAVALSASNIAFRHDSQSPWLFRELNFNVEAGQCVAITGPSGAGKTSLLKLLMGLAALDEGELRVNNAPIKSLAHYRNWIAAVTQDDLLLSGNLLDNIVGFDASPNWEWMRFCCQQACIDNFIEQLPMQYNTPVGEMGASLSGGQMQRLLLARALYRKPALLFLDEATSQLDVGTESAINANLSQMPMTRVVISHRPTVAAMADATIQLGSRRPEDV